MSANVRRRQSKILMVEAKLTALRVESVVKNIRRGKNVHKRKQRVGPPGY